jgi:hypothetical protein
MLRCFNICNTCSLFCYLYFNLLFLLLLCLIFGYLIRLGLLGYLKICSSGPFWCCCLLLRPLYSLTRCHALLEASYVTAGVFYTPTNFFSSCRYYLGFLGTLTSNGFQVWVLNRFSLNLRSWSGTKREGCSGWRWCWCWFGTNGFIPRWSLSNFTPF